MSRWSRIVIAIALFGCGAWVAAGIAGDEAGRGPGPLGLHTLVAFGATLALLLADIWLIVYLLAGARLARAAGIDLGALAAGRRAVCALAVLAAALAVCAFSLAGALYPDRLSPVLHTVLAVATLAAHAILLVAAVRHLARHESALAAR
jgi:hypothetical protein